MRQLLLTFLLFNIVSSYGQIPTQTDSSQHGYNHGTFIIVTICKEGILVGADSRTAVYVSNDADLNSTPDAYFDGAQKIVPMKDYVIAIQGKANIGNRSVLSYLHEFNNTLIDNQSTLELRLNQWVFYVNKTYKDQADQFFQFNYLSAKYENGKPIICGVIGNQRYTCSSIGYLETDSSEFDKLFRLNESYKLSAKKIKKAIYKYAKDHHKEFVIGGPISLLLITPDNKYRWLMNEPKIENQFNSMDKIWESYKQNKLRLCFPTKEGEEKVNKKVFGNK